MLDPVPDFHVADAYEVRGVLCAANGADRGELEIGRRRGVEYWDPEGELRRPDAETRRECVRFWSRPPF